MVANASLNPKFVAPPVPLTSLIGREHEVGLALTLLRRPEVRLLTLTGPGGIGKTSLALAIAAKIGPELGNGVYFAPLAGLTDPGSFASAVARAAGLVETSDTPVRDTLVSAFAQTESMLVLDNFEHLLAAAHLVSDLLAVCPRLTIVVTSRVLLRISGEYALPVPPLAVPDAEGIVSRDALMQSAAGQLFAQRAQAIAPSFEVNDDNAVEVANICRRLDGVPLAIELAAARITHLSLPELLTLLERRLPLLTGGGRDRPLRLQTMRNAIAWSHDLLRPEEQVLFRRLAVFAGGFSLDAATFVAGDGEAPALDTVAALVEASMVRSETAASGPTRYGMLATIREFAEERLESSGEAETIRDQHATYYANLADRFELVEMLANGDQALAQLDAEQDNVRAALLRLEKQNEPQRLLRLAAAFGYYWIARSHYVEGRAWLERSLALSGGVAESHASALVALGIIEAYQGSSEIAKLHLDEGLAGCRAQGDAFSEANALIALAAMAIREGDNVHATELLEACLLAAHAVPNQRLSDIMAGRTLINFAAVARALGDYELAVEHLRPALHLMRESGYAPGILLALGDLGDLARDQGNVALALDYYREALALGESHSGTREVSDVVEDVGVVASTLGQAERAATLLGAAESMRERIGLRFRVEQNQRVLDQAIAACRTALTEQAFAACWSTGRSLTPSQAVVAALEPLHLPVIAAGVHLTSREAEILRLLAAGLTDPAIADKLFISVRTVENHAARIFTKLGVRTRTAAVTSAIAKGLLHPDSPPPA